MLTGELRSKIDGVWNAFAAGGISNPLEVIEQITYLLFIRRLDDLHTLEVNRSARFDKPMARRVFQDGKDLGQGPVNVEVPEGKNVELQIVREGYKNARVVIDGSEGTQAIKLEKVAVATRPSKAPKPQTTQPKPAATKKRPSLGSGEIIDPWSK